MAAAGDLTTLDAVRRDLGTQSPADNFLLEEWITGASGWIVSYLNQPVLSTQHVEVMDGHGGPRLFLKYTPIISVSLVKVAGITYSAATAGGTDTGYFFDPSGLLRLRNSTFARGIGNVQITYTAGYATAPAAIERACVRIVGWRYKEKDRLGHASKGIGGETVAYQTAAAAEDVLKVLDSFKRVVP